MGQIYIYDSLDTKKNVIRANGKLKDILPDYDFSKALVLSNGSRLDREYEVKPEDTLFIRAVPGGVSLVTVAIVVSVIAAGAAIGTAIYAAIQNQKLQDAMNKAQKQAKANTSVEELPFLKGAKNRNALGNEIPFVMGEMFHTPYKLYAGHYTLSGVNGADQYWNAILCSGYSGQIIKSVSIGDVKVLDRSSDTAPQNAVYSVTEGMYAAPQNKIEIRNGEEFDTEDFRQKVVAVACGDEVVYDSADTEPTPLIKQLEPNAMGVDVEVEFNGLRSMDDDGDWNSHTVTVVPSWSNDNGSNWHEFTFNQNGTLSNSFRYNSSKTIRFVAHKDFTAAESFGKSIQVRLVRTNKKSSNGRTQDTVRCGYYQTFCYDTKKSTSSSLVPCVALTDQFRDCTTRIGLHFIANDSTSGELNEINIIACGVARTWDGSNWSTGKSITRNPASWILEILTSGTHPHSKFNDSEIDLPSLGALYEYCEEQELYCDGVVTKGSKKGDVLGKILEECFSTLIMNRYGKLEVCIDREEEIPVALINSQSIVSSTVTKNFERQIDGKKATFINRKEWQTDTMYVMRDGTMTKRPEQSATEFSMTYATTPEHTFKFIQRQLLKASLQPREIKVNVGKEGDYYPLYSTVKLQMPQMRVGNVSTVIHSIDLSTKKIVVADNVTFENGKSYGLIIEGVTDAGRKEFNIRVEGTGTTNVLSIPAEFDTSAIDTDFIEYGNVASFGELVDGSFSKVTNVMKIMGINSNEDGVQLTLRDYDEDIYHWESGVPVPSFKSNLTSVPMSSPMDAPGLTYNELADNMELMEEFTKGAIENGDKTKKPDLPVFKSAYVYKDYIEFILDASSDDVLSNEIKQVTYSINKNGTKVTLTGGLTARYYFNRSTDGYLESSSLLNWTFSYIATNVYGVDSDTSQDYNFNTSKYGTWLLNAPEVMTRISDRTATLLMSLPERADGKEQYGNIKYQISVKRFDDTEYYCPATSTNPYDAEANYKNTLAENNYIEASDVYSQCLPLKGQSTSEIVDTMYSFRVKAVNEASESSNVDVNVTALCTSIRDIVKAKETAKEAYISELSAISANIGVISEGGITGGKENYWALSTITDNGKTYKKGEFRVGGTEQYIVVKPIGSDPVTGDPLSYEIEFKVGNFQITTTATSFSGEVILQENENSLDRAYIAPNKVSLQHRDSVNSAWYDITNMDTSGIMGKSYRSSDDILIGNFTQTKQRSLGHDIGRAYLSNNAKVWHFDDNVYCNDGTSGGLAITGEYRLRGVADNNVLRNTFDYTPAVLNVAPYCNNARAITGRFSLAKTIENANKVTVDFWMQYLYEESQTLFNIGNTNDKIIVQLTPDEPVAVVSGSCSWRHTSEGVIWTSNRNPYIGDAVYSSDPDEYDTDPVGYISEVRVDANYLTVGIKKGNDKEFVFDTGDADYNWETYAPEEVWGDTSVVANRAIGGQKEILHQGQTKKESVSLESIGKDFKDYEWGHIAVTFTQNKIKLMFMSVNDDTEEIGIVTFNRYGSSADDFVISVNSSLNSILIDELYIDTEEEYENHFLEQTKKRYPWGALDCTEKKWFIFDAEDPTKVRSNVLDYFKSTLLASDEFKNAVRALI